MDLARFSGWLTAYRQASTRDGYICDVETFWKWAKNISLQSPAEITHDILVQYIGHRREHGIGANALRRSVYALRIWLAWEWADRKLEPPHPAADLKAPRARRRLQRSLTADQLAAVLGSCDTSTVQGVRDVAMIALMTDTGIRSAEVCRLNLTDLDMGRRLLEVVVKGGDESRRVFHPITATFLWRWLEARADVASCPAVFVDTAHRGTRLTTGGLRAIFRRIGKQAGLRAFSPHDLRRTFAMLATEAHAPTRVTQVGGGWGDIKLVETYTQALAVEAFRPYSPVAFALSNRGPGDDSQTEFTSHRGSA